MGISDRAVRLGAAALAACMLIGCETLAGDDLAVTPAVTPHATSLPMTAPPTARPALTPTPALNQSWRPLATGLEYQEAHIPTPYLDDSLTWLTLARIDPDRLTFRALYAPDAVQTVRRWQAASGASVAINAGFFTAANQAIGLVIADGRVFGQTYRGFGGMFYVRDGVPGLQWLAARPYTPDRRITQAVQSFPMLIHDGQVVDGIPEDGSRSRRSFVGLDEDGRIILGVTALPAWRLTDLADFLAHRSGLALRQVLNLDGGGSAGIWMSGVPDMELVDSIDPVPAVLTASLR